MSILGPKAILRDPGGPELRNLPWVANNRFQKNHNSDRPGPFQISSRINACYETLATLGPKAPVTPTGSLDSETCSPPSEVLPINPGVHAQVSLNNFLSQRLNMSQGQRRCSIVVQTVLALEGFLHILRTALALERFLLSL